jgi:hypothetical protein
VLVVSVLAMAFSGPVLAEVEKVTIRTTGISCGACAVVSEIQFRRMPDIADVAISLSNESITLSYKPGTTFGPRQIRQVLQLLDVGVVQFQIRARGRVQQRGGKRFFIAGKDEFVLAAADNGAAIPVDAPVLIEGIINDRLDPLELRISTFKPLEK